MKNDKIKEEIGLYKGVFFTFIALVFSISGSLIVSFRADSLDAISIISFIILPIAIIISMAIYSKILQLIDKIRED